MHEDGRELDLTFPSLPCGKRAAVASLTRLLYKGGAGIERREALKLIASGSLGPPLQDRSALLVQVHEAIAAKYAAGGSDYTARTQIKAIEQLYRWAEGAKQGLLNLESIQTVYLQWSEHLFHRANVVKDQKAITVYTQARVVGQVLDDALGRATPLIELTRVREPKGVRKPVGAKADKQNLEATFAFGHLLQNICDELPLQIIWGPRPVRFALRSGGEIVIWMGKHVRSEAQAKAQSRSNARQTRAKELEYEQSTDLIRRSGSINMRILAEMLIFIGQTGMNLTQASNLELRHFSYSSDIDGYKVRDYKARRGGEVLFEIFREYRSHFERYLEWRRQLFPGEVRLFPLLRRGAHPDSRPCFELITDACEQAGVEWIPPSHLRGTRVNWLLRRSGDPDLTAELSQHHKTTLLRVYEIPSHQRALTEITRFWQSADPVLTAGDPFDAVSPGKCDGKPEAVKSIPDAATKPDCIQPSGCLWCEHHRDIDSIDYVWALASFRHLKVLELSKSAKTSVEDDHPAQLAIDRLSEKLTWFRESNSSRLDWVKESLARIEEGSYQEDWEHLILAIESPSK